MQDSNATGKSDNILHNRVLQCILLGIWAVLFAVIIYMGLKTSPLPLSNPFDKLLHIGSCAVVILLPAILSPRRSYIYASAAILFLAGLGIEIYQSFLPGREASLADLMADVAGIVIGVGIALYVRHLYRK